MIDLKSIFEKRISKEPKVRSINGVFIAIDYTLEKTNFEPSYQRNYVWDNEKATYFLESIFLGTEVPPIILFKSEDEDGFITYEVIDGRQRYETIIRFLNNTLKLKKSGLQRLNRINDLVGKTYQELDSKYQDIFKETKIRTIEYSFIGDYTKEEEDAVKREIFQRYNSGITPLKTFEIDKAKYLRNDLNESIHDLLEDDVDFDNMFTEVFLLEKLKPEQKVIKIRELLVLHRIPIKYYATKKQTVISRFFEYMSSQLDEEENVLDVFRNKVVILYKICNALKSSGIAYNRLYAECLCWATYVMDDNRIPYDLSDNEIIDRLTSYLKDHESYFTTVKSSFYGILVGRYKTMAKFFEDEYACSFNLAIENNTNFKETNKLMSARTSITEPSMEAMSFDELRINKQDPTSVEITELLDNLKSNRFILRPSYQRADVNNRKKSSAIIESMLLGIMLPPIFVFRRKDGISEVVDGQQRLLSIIAFIGETYKDENGNTQTPLLHNFKLELGENSILKSLKGSTYVKLSKSDQNKIRKTSIYIIEIKQELNPKFDQVDLFVRLNNKPYPIASDSFEMWNSFAPESITRLVKDVVKSNESWFYLRKNNSRMHNENMFATLAYFQHQYLKYGIEDKDIAPKKTVELYLVDKRIAARFRMRGEITKLMYDSKFQEFQNTVNTLDFSFVSSLYTLLNNAEISKQELNKSMNEMLMEDNGKRSQMMFYILWILLHDLPCDVIYQNKIVIKEEVERICKMLNTCQSIDDFKNSVRSFRDKYTRNYHSMHFLLGGVVEEVDGDKQYDIIVPKSPREDYRFDARNAIENSLDPDVSICLSINRYGFDTNFLVAFLRSRLFFHAYSLKKGKLTSTSLNMGVAPYISMDDQKLFTKVLAYIDASEGPMKVYFERILDLMFYELFFAGVFDHFNIHVVDEIRRYPDLAEAVTDENRKVLVHNIYNEQTQTNNVMSMYLLKAIDVEMVRITEIFMNQ